MRKTIFLLIFFAVIITTGLFWQKLSHKPSGQYNTKIQVADKALFVEVVKTKAAMAQGLSGRETMQENQGMLFDYGENASLTPGFWMPNMKFNIDIIWIKNKRIIGITKNIPAPVGNFKQDIRHLNMYHPPSGVNMVLEVNAGWSDKNDIKIGNEIIF